MTTETPPPVCPHCGAALTNPSDFVLIYECGFQDFQHPVAGTQRSYKCLQRENAALREKLTNCDIIIKDYCDLEEEIKEATVKALPGFDADGGGYFVCAKEAAESLISEVERLREQLAEACLERTDAYIMWTTEAENNKRLRDAAIRVVFAGETFVWRSLNPRSLQAALARLNAVLSPSTAETAPAQSCQAQAPASSPPAPPSAARGD